MSRDVNVLVTGGAGFLGAHLAAALLADGHRVIVYDDLSRPGADEVARRLNARFDATGRLAFVFRDVRDASEIGRAVYGCDAVVHGAVGGTDDAVALNPTEDFQVRVGGTIALLEALRTRAPEAHLVLASTLSVYGAAPVIEQRMTIAADERFKASPCTPAGAAALSAESYALAYAKSYGLTVTALRLAQLYGADGLADDEGWVGRLVVAARDRRPFVAPVPLAFPVDLLHVADAVRAIQGVLAMPKACAGLVLNAGGGAKSAPAMRQVASLVAELGGETAVEPPEPLAQPAFVLDCKKLRSITGWQPAIGWREGITRLVQRAAPHVDLRDALRAEALGEETHTGKALVAWPRAEGLA